MEKFVSPQVEDLVRKALDSPKTALIVDETIRAIRTCFTDERMGVVWIIAEQTQISADGGVQDGLWLHTNDSDLLVGLPPSFSEKLGWNDADSLLDQAFAFLSKVFSQSSALTLLIQTDLDSGTYVPSLVAESEAGFSHIHEQESMLAI